MMRVVGDTGRGWCGGELHGHQPKEEGDICTLLGKNGEEDK
jgi:hypothetical protein